MKEKIISHRYLDRILDKNIEGKRILKLFFRKKCVRYMPKNIPSFVDFFQQPLFITLESEFEKSYILKGIHWYNVNDATLCSLSAEVELNKIAHDLNLFSIKTWC